jgi:hypothetical protein
MDSRTPVPAANIYRMMYRLGIDAAAGVVDQFGLAFACAVRTCGGCGAVGACSAWLDGIDCARCAPAFCPNVSLLFELTCQFPHVGLLPERRTAH